MSGTVNEDATHAPPNAAPVVATSSDEEIYCPICNYNLTGILTGRCPECGSLFDREALRANQQANRITLIPWDDPAETAFWPRLKKTLPICLFDAKRFAFAFSVQPQDSRAYSFFLLATFGACALSILVFFASLPLYRLFEMEIGLEEAVLFGLLMIGAIFATVLTTTLAVAFALGIFCPHFDGKRHLRPWLSISYYASAHYLIFPLGLPVSVLFEWGSRELFGLGLTLGALMTGLACGLLNAFTLNAVIRHRSAPSSGRSVATLAVFIIYILFPLVVPGCVVTLGIILFEFLGI
ncbi:MAG TPA: hypothetical protein VJZ71_02970 [Phycisphaerae bacterium]|nr:hypothetical protein [Phycisphaerae bacterium]